MKAPSRLPGALLITVGVMAALYVGVLVYAHIIGKPALPVQINTLVIVGLAATLVALFHWLVTARSEERTAKRLQEAPRRSAVGTATVHQIGVSRPRVVEPEWPQNDATIVLDVRNPQPKQPRRRRRARQATPVVPGLDAEVIAIGKRISGRLHGDSA